MINSTCSAGPGECPIPALRLCDAAEEAACSLRPGLIIADGASA